MKPAALLLILGLSAFAQSLVFRDVRMFDGARVLGRTTVVITNGRIAAMGVDVKAPAGAQVIEGTGKTLLPGFIDAHTHTLSTDALKQAPIFGVTTTFDMFTVPQTVASAKKANRADSADLLSAGYLATSPGGHGTEYGLKIPTLTKPEEAQAWVDARLAEGSDYIKIVYDDGRAYGMKMPTLSKETVQGLVDAAHKRSKLAVVHIGTIEDAQDAINAGADGIVHLFTGEKTAADFGKLAAAHKAFVIPTLSVMCGAGVNAKLADDPLLKPFLPVNEASNMKRTFANFTPRCAGTYDALKQLKAEGVPILAGSDVPNPGTTQGATIHGELELLVQAGLTPVEALRAATAAPAKAFRLNDRGEIAVGKRADVLLVAGDPTVDIKATRNIDGVWKLGTAIDRSAWKAGVAKSIADEANRRASPAPPGSESGLVSDFESGKADVKFGAGWMISVDQMMGGKSQAKMAVAEGALVVTGEVMTGFAAPWAGVMFSPGPSAMAPANLSSKKDIVFRAKGDGQTYRIMAFAQKLGFQPAIQMFVAGPEWKEFRFPLTKFNGIDGSDLMALVWTGGPATGKFEFRLDDVRFE